MKLFRLTAFISIITAIFAVSVFAQTAQTGKVVVINTNAFDNNKTGITKYFNAMDSVEKEFLTVTTQLQTLATRSENLRKEIETLQEQAKKTPTVPIKPETIAAKVEEYEKLGREFKFKQEEAKASFDRRVQVVMGPIRLDIGKAMDEFATKKGYALILDSSKLGQAGVILVLDKTADVTDEFIKFYNARPAGSATAKPE